MGFRSTLMTEDYRGVNLPEWFVKKYDELFFFGEGEGKPALYIASKREIKTYFSIADDIVKDLQTVCIENKVSKLVAVWLHECGGITRVQITPENITYSEPTGWKVVDEVTHNYCYGCSDIKLEDSL